MHQDCAHERQQRWTFHFTPTSSSWLNAVEGFFAILARRRLRHGVSRSFTDPQAVINRFICEHNQTPNPFIRRADPEAISLARHRGLQALGSIHQSCTADTEYGGIRAELEAAGKPIGPNDLLIAAHACALNAVLVTANASEFRRVRGLRVENWLEGS